MNYQVSLEVTADLDDNANWGRILLGVAISGFVVWRVIQIIMDIGI